MSKHYRTVTLTDGQEVTVEIPYLENFCQPVRNALTLAGYSTEKVRNVINSENGNMDVVKIGDSKMGDMKYKETKRQSKFGISVKPGSIRFESKGFSYAKSFHAWHDIVAKAHDIMPTMTVTIGDTYKEWLDEIHYGKVTQPNPANTDTVNV